MAANQYMQPWFDTLSQGVQVAQQLRQAALQQQALEQAKQQFAAQQDLHEREFGLQQQLAKSAAIQQGAKPVDPNANTSEPMPELNPLSMVPGQPQFQDSGTTNVPADTGRTISVGGSTLQVPTLQDKLNQEIAQQQAIEKGTMPTAGQIFGNELAPGADPNVPVPNAGQVLAGRAYAQGMRGQQPQAPQGSYKDYSDNNSGHVTRIFFDGAGNELKRVDLGKVVGEKDPAGGAAGEKQVTPDAALASRNKALEDYQKSSKEESDLEQQTLALGTALKSGQHYVDKNGTLKRFDPSATPEEIAAQQDSMRGDLAMKQKRLMEVIAEKNDAMQRYGPTPQVSTAQAQAAIRKGMAPEAGGPIPSSASTVKSAAASKPAVKTARVADVQAYAQKKGITQQQAQQEFQQAGYQIQ